MNRVVELGKRDFVSTGTRRVMIQDPVMDQERVWRGESLTHYTNGSVSTRIKVWKDTVT